LNNKFLSDNYLNRATSDSTKCKHQTHENSTSCGVLKTDNRSVGRKVNKEVGKYKREEEDSPRRPNYTDGDNERKEYGY